MKISGMKVLLPLLVGTATSSFAATYSSEQTGSGMLTWFFIGFGIMVLVFQVVPAVMMFFSMVKGIFSSSPAEASFSPWKGKTDK